MRGDDACAASLGKAAEPEPTVGTPTSVKAVANDPGKDVRALSQEQPAGCLLSSPVPAYSAW